MSDIASIDVEFWTKLGAGVMAFLGGACALVGGREGAADRKKPVPDPAEAGAVSLIADGRTLTRIADCLDDLAEDMRAWRREDEMRRHDDIFTGRLDTVERNQGLILKAIADLSAKPGVLDEVERHRQARRPRDE